MPQQVGPQPADQQQWSNAFRRRYWPSALYCIPQTNHAKRCPDELQTENTSLQTLGFREPKADSGLVVGKTWHREERQPTVFAESQTLDAAVESGNGCGFLLLLLREPSHSPNPYPHPRRPNLQPAYATTSHGTHRACKQTTCLLRTVSSDLIPRPQPRPSPYRPYKLYAVPKALNPRQTLNGPKPFNPDPQVTCPRSPTDRGCGSQPPSLQLPPGAVAYHTSSH